MATFGFGGQATQPSVGGSLFGQPATQNTQPATNTSAFGGSLFGGQSGASTSTGGGLFGQTTPAVGGSLFGQPAQQQQQQQQQQPALGQSLFGGSTFGGQQQQQPQGQGLFGNTQNQSSMFGNTMLGGQQQPQQQQQQQQPQGSLFGGATQGNSLFGGQAQQSQFGQQNNGNQFQNQQSQYGQQGNRVRNEMMKVTNKWNRNHPDCEFKYYFYNNVGKENASRHAKNVNEDEKAYDKAWNDRPSESLVPILAIGFGDLEIRVKQQQNQVYTYRTVLHTILGKLDTLQQKHDLATSIKLEDCRRRHIALARRALSLAAQVQVIKNRGYALHPEEEEMKKKLESLSKRVNDPQINGKVNEIWARMTMVRERARQMNEEVAGPVIEWDEKQLKITSELLSTNAKGLEYLTSQVKQIEKELTQWEEDSRTNVRGR